MILNNLFRYPKAKTRPYGFLGCEERFKDSSQVRGRDSCAIVCNRNANSWNAPISILPAPIALSVSDSDTDCPIKKNRINAVAQQIGENLAQFTRKPDNLSFRIKVQLDVDSPVLGLGGKHREQVPPQIRYYDRLRSCALPI